MKIKSTVKDAMQQLQIKKLRRNQIKPINSVLNGHDTLVIAPTSYGKSLLYQIPAVVNSRKLTVVIEPLLALIHDQVEKLKKLEISAAYLDSTQSKAEREQVMKPLNNREVTLLYLAPERLETGILSQIEKPNKIGLVVVGNLKLLRDFRTEEDYWKKTYIYRSDYIQAQGVKLIESFPDALIGKRVLRLEAQLRRKAMKKWAGKDVEADAVPLVVPSLHEDGSLRLGLLGRRTDHFSVGAGSMKQ